jgi:phage shock protein E
MKFLSAYKLILLGLILGAAAGYADYYFVGCHSGTCSITSKPTNSTLYGAMMGGLLFGIFKKEKKNKPNEPGDGTT